MISSNILRSIAASYYIIALIPPYYIITFLTVEKI